MVNCSLQEKRAKQTKDETKPKNIQVIIQTWWSSSRRISSMASSMPNRPRNIARGIISECAAAAMASMEASWQSFVFLSNVSISFVRPSSCLPPKKLEYTTGLNPNSDSTHWSIGSIFSSCFSETRIMWNLRKCWHIIVQQYILVEYWLSIRFWHKMFNVWVESIMFFCSNNATRTFYSLF